MSRIALNFEARRERSVNTKARQCHLFPQKRAVFRHDSTIRDQQGSPRNYAAIIKVIVADHLELSLVSAAHVSICDLLRLDVFVQFLLPIFQTHGDIGGAF
jgi:hypothetical protein